jgi:outer membrane protein TolC
MIKAFKYTVTLPPADDLENLDSAMTSMKIPARVEDAVTIAISQGPEVIRRNLNVDMAEYSLKAVRASLGPSVTLSAGRNHQNSSSALGSTHSGSVSTSIAVTLNIPLGVAGGHYSVKAAAKNLESSRSQREAAINDAKNSIEVLYTLLETQRETYIEMNKSYDTQLAKLQKTIEKINSGDTADIQLSDLLISVNSLTNQFFGLQDTQRTILTSLFNVNQVTGLLFREYASPNQ